MEWTRKTRSRRINCNYRLRIGRFWKLHRLFVFTSYSLKLDVVFIVAIRDWFYHTVYGALCDTLRSIFKPICILYFVRLEGTIVRKYLSWLLLKIRIKHGFHGEMLIMPTDSDVGNTKKERSSSSSSPVWTLLWNVILT